MSWIENWTVLLLSLVQFHYKTSLKLSSFTSWTIISTKIKILLIHLQIILSVVDIT